MLLRVPWALIGGYLLADLAMGIGVFRYFYELSTGSDAVVMELVVQFGVWGRAALLVVLFFVFLRAPARGGTPRAHGMPRPPGSGPHGGAMTGPWFEQPTLTGEYVRLEPLALAHAEDLYRAADDPTLFRWTWRLIESVSDATEYISHALDDPQRLASSRSTPRPAWWSAPPRTIRSTRSTSRSRSATPGSPLRPGRRINPEAKLLLLRRAFEDLGAVRVEWHTDELDAHSRGAIAKLGAEFEGLLPNTAVARTEVGATQRFSR